MIQVCFIIRQIHEILFQVRDRLAEKQIIFIKSWNEWAEGNYLEPDQEHGDGYLRVIKESLLG